MTTPAHREAVEAAREVKNALLFVAPISSIDRRAALDTIAAELRNRALILIATTAAAAEQTGLDADAHEAIDDVAAALVAMADALSEVRGAGT